MSKTARDCLIAASQAGFRFHVLNEEGTIDYDGFNPRLAWEACKAVEIAWVHLRRPPNKERNQLMVIAHGVADDETLADYAGRWVAQWDKENDNDER